MGVEFATLRAMVEPAVGLGMGVAAAGVAGAVAPRCGASAAFACDRLTPASTSHRFTAFSAAISSRSLCWPAGSRFSLTVPAPASQPLAGGH